MSLIKSTEELQKYLSVVGTLKVETVLPFVQDAQNKYMRRFLGAGLLADLEAFVTSDEIAGDWPAGSELVVDAETVTAALQALIPYVLDALAAFALFEATPSLDVKVTDSGFAVISNNNLAPASAERVKQFRTSMEQLGFARTETLLTFLENNQADYPTWMSSEAYSWSTNNFCRNAEEFDKIVNIEQSRLRFMRYRPTMDNVDLLQIEPVISKELSDDIKDQVRASNVSDAYNRILPLLKRAEVFLTAGVEIDPKYTEIGLQYLAQVKKILDANIDDYPLYQESDCYDTTATGLAAWENTEESPTFLFGG